MATRTMKVRIQGDLTLEFEEDDARDRYAIAEDGWPANHQEFGMAVRRAREMLGLSRLAFSKKVGVADSTIRNVEAARHQCGESIRRCIVKVLAKLGQPPPSQPE